MIRGKAQLLYIFVTEQVNTFMNRCQAQKYGHMFISLTKTKHMSEYFIFDPTCPNNIKCVLKYDVFKQPMI